MDTILDPNCCCIAVQTAPFDVQVQLDALQRRCGLAAGAMVQFVGVVRGQEVQALELEHYPGMTEKALTAIAQAAQQRFQLLAISVIHRVGRLLQGESIVLVAVAAAHRRAAFEGAHFVMDYLKTQAPFWKKEHLRNGASRWVDARATDDSALARWLTYPEHPKTNACAERVHCGCAAPQPHR